LQWMKSIFARKQRFAQRPLDEIPEHTISPNACVLTC
jgi:hypothetical protein